MDIKKQLILEVSLGTQKLKAEIDGLKKDLNRNMGGAQGSANDMQKARQINQMYKERSKVQETTDRAYIQRQKEVSREQEKASKELAKLSMRKEREAKKEQERIQKNTEREVKQNESVIEKEQMAKQRAEQKEAQRAEKQRQKDFNQEKQTIAQRYEFLKKKRLEDSIQQSQLDRTLTARAGRAVGMSPGGARSLASNIGGIGRAAGSLASGGASAVQFNEYLQTLGASRRYEATSNLLSGQNISQYSKDYGRSSNMFGQGLVGAGGAFAGAKLGAGIGALGGGVPGALVGGLAGAAVGGIGSVLGYQEYRANRFQKETQPVQDAQNSAMGLNSQRLNMIKRGGSAALLNLNEAQGAAYGFAPGEANSQYETLQGMLGNQGAASTITSARRLNMNTGASIQDSGQLLQSLQGGNRQGFGQNAMSLEMVVSRGMANGLDRSKTSKFLQETSNLIASTTGFAQLNTGSVTDRFTSLASSFGNGTIDDTSMAQARDAFARQQQGSFARGGLEGLGNVLNMNDLSAKYGLKVGGQDYSNLLGTSANARVEDILPALSSDLQSNPKTKEFLSELIQSKSQNAQKAIGSLGMGTSLMIGGANGQPTEQNLAYYNKTTATALNAGTSLTNDEALGGQEQGMAARNARLQKAEVDLGRETFKSAIDNTAKDLDRLRTSFSDAVKVFNEVLKDMNMEAIKYKPAYSGDKK
jgi:hypothetical protein